MLFSQRFYLDFLRCTYKLVTPALKWFFFLINETFKIIHKICLTLNKIVSCNIKRQFKMQQMIFNLRVIVVE